MIVEAVDPQAVARVEGMPRRTHRTAVEDREPPAAALRRAEPCGELAAPQRYKVQFTTTEEYVRLVEEAKALLSHAVPQANLEQVQLRAMRAFVEELRKRKYGTSASVAAAAEQSPSSPVTEDRGAAASLRSRSIPPCGLRTMAQRRQTPAQRCQNRAGAGVTFRWPFEVPLPDAMVTAAPIRMRPAGVAQRRVASSSITSCLSP